MCFLPFNKTLYIAYAVCGVLIYSGYIIYDTQQISKRYSPDQYIMASLMLYIE